MGFSIKLGICLVLLLTLGEGGSKSLQWCITNQPTFQPTCLVKGYSPLTLKGCVTSGPMMEFDEFYRCTKLETRLIRKCNHKCGSKAGRFHVSQIPDVGYSLPVPWCKTSKPKFERACLDLGYLPHTLKGCESSRSMIMPRVKEETCKVMENRMISECSIQKCGKMKKIQQRT